jgi:hypothetical protein
VSLFSVDDRLPSRRGSICRNLCTHGTAVLMPSNLVDGEHALEKSTVSIFSAEMYT